MTLGVKKNLNKGGILSGSFSFSSGHVWDVQIS